VVGVALPLVDIAPSKNVRRHAITWPGGAAELVQCVKRDCIEFRFNAPVHLLAVYERALRQAGETSVNGIACSSVRDLARKLTFVPANCQYRDFWHEPQVPPRVYYFYLDAADLAAIFDRDAPTITLAPRVCFEDGTLWHTAMKIKSLIEKPMSGNRCYAEALGLVLAHEVARLGCGTPRTQPQTRGGLAAWQERAVASYIEEHLAEPISLAELADLARLTRISHTKKCIGAPNQRKLLCGNDFLKIRGRPDDDRL
jgi:AraC family transcriptional regulator